MTRADLNAAYSWASSTRVGAVDLLNRACSGAGDEELAERLRDAVIALHRVVTVAEQRLDAVTVTPLRKGARHG